VQAIKETRLRSDTSSRPPTHAFCSGTTTMRYPPAVSCGFEVERTVPQPASAPPRGGGIRDGGDDGDGGGGGDDEGDEKGGEGSGTDSATSSEEGKLKRVKYSEVENFETIQVTQDDMGILQDERTVLVQSAKCAWLKTTSAPCRIIVIRKKVLYTEAAGTVKRNKDGDTCTITANARIDPHVAVSPSSHAGKRARSPSPPPPAPPCIGAGGGSFAVGTPSAKRKCVASTFSGVHTLAGPPTLKAVAQSLPLGKGNPLGASGDMVTENLFTSIARDLTPAIQFSPNALVPFMRQSAVSLTPLSRGRVLDDWTCCIVATDQKCREAGLIPPYLMLEQPADSIAKRWRCENDKVVVEVHFHMFLGADRAEVQALKAEMHTKQTEMERKHVETERSLRAEMLTKQAETERKQVETERKQVETERQMNELRNTLTYLQKIMGEKDANEQADMQKIKEQTQSNKQMLKEQRKRWNMNYQKKHVGGAVANTIEMREQSFQCTHDKCDKTFPTKGMLSRHTRCHKDIRFECGNVGCCKAFKDARNLRTHADRCGFTST
jgi:hypothetical protein